MGSTFTFPNLTHDKYHALIMEAAGGDLLDADIEPVKLEVVEAEWVIHPKPKIRQEFRVQWLNVDRPHYYRASDGAIVLVLPAWEAATYELLAQIINDPDEPLNEWYYPWAFVLSSPGDELEDLEILFLHGEYDQDGGVSLPDFVLEEQWTH